MATARDTPYGNSNFLVDFGQGDARSTASGFFEVAFPPFTADSGGAGAPLVLRRGVTGHLDLYSWWDGARRGKDLPGRRLEVSLLPEDGAGAVLTWTFHGARPVSLEYSRLNALDGSVLMETLSVAFDSMEVG